MASTDVSDLVLVNVHVSNTHPGHSDTGLREKIGAVDDVEGVALDYLLVGVGGPGAIHNSGSNGDRLLDGFKERPIETD